MQLRALIKTRKRKWAMIVLGVVVCAAAVWLLLDAVHKPTDEEKYRSMQRAQKWGMRWYSLRSRHKLPTPLDSKVRKFEKSSFEKSYKQQKELLASGYLVHLTVTNKLSDIARLTKQLGTEPLMNAMLKVDGAIITCRSNDVPDIRAALEQKP